MEPALVPSRQPERSAIEKLPVEIQQDILCRVADVKSLGSVILSCTSLYDAYDGYKREIVHNILVNQTNPYLRYETLATGEVTILKPLTPDQTISFLKEYWKWHSRPFYAIPKVNIREGRLVSDLYANIRYFTDDFIKCALANRPLDGCGPDAGMWAPTQKEINRIERTFYRYETFCQIFGDPKTAPFTLFQQHEVYFRKHPGWENEQFACVHEYLTNKILPGMTVQTLESGFRQKKLTSCLFTVFYELADRDRDWINYLSVLDEGISSSCVEYNLSKGLNHVRAIVDTKSLEECKQVLGSPYSTSRFEFLRVLLRLFTSHEYFSTYQPFSRPNPAVPPKPTVCDLDTGPKRVWTWCQDFSGRHTSKGEWPAPLRLWGYVMWDLRRLQSWHILDRPFHYDVRAYWEDKLQRHEGNRAAIKARSDEMDRLRSEDYHSLIASLDAFSLVLQKRKALLRESVSPACRSSEAG